MEKKKEMHFLMQREKMKYFHWDLLREILKG